MKKLDKFEGDKKPAEGKKSPPKPQPEVIEEMPDGGLVESKKPMTGLGQFMRSKIPQKVPSSPAVPVVTAPTVTAMESIRPSNGFRINVSTSNAPHLIIQARAGTGKTTTLIEGLKRMRGMEVSITPSPQQAAIWDALDLSKDARSICMVAFNSSIASELKRRVPPGVEAKTMNSLGNYAVMKAFPDLRNKELSLNRNQDIVAKLLGNNRRDMLNNPMQAPILYAVSQLVDLCKMNLLEGTQDDLWHLEDHYVLDLEQQRSKIFDLVPQVLELSKDVKQGGGIGFADQLWLPVILNLPVFRNDVLLVDEAQDLNRCQQALAKRAGRRLILCGDNRQAIYGFAGADSSSMGRMRQELSGKEALINLAQGMPTELIPTLFKGACEPPRCVVLPLTVTRRCGKAIVKEANAIVADFTAHESNPDGLVRTDRYLASKDGKDPSYHQGVQDGDMVVCAHNGPLINQCFKFLRLGRKAQIQGRKDVGAGLITFIKRMDKRITNRSDEIASFIEQLTEWLHGEQEKENAKKDPKQSKLDALQDRYDCLVCFTEDDEIETVADMVKKIEEIFTDDQNSPGIKLSSIHKAKGLESHRVFILMPPGAECPKFHHRMNGWQREQQMNLKYVAITRAIEELVYVS